MGKIKPATIILVIVMLASVLASCSAPGKKGKNVIKADDPWYESTRFKLDKSLRKNDRMLSAKICTGDDRFYSIYTSTNDSYATTRIVLDSYDYSGKRVGRTVVTYPEMENFRVYDIYSVSADPDGKTLKTILSLSASGKVSSIFADIDIETGIVTNMKKLLSGKAERYDKTAAGLLHVSRVGDYVVDVLDRSEGYEHDYQLLLFKDYEFVCELDLSSLNLSYLDYGFSINAAAGSLYAVGTERSDLVTMEFDLQSGKLKNKNAFLKTDADPVDITEFSVTDNGDLCRLDSLGNIEKLDVNTMTVKTCVDTYWYTPFIQTLYCREHRIISSVLSCTDDRVVICDNEEYVFGGFDKECIDYVRVLKKTDKNPNAGKEIVEIYLPDSGLSDYLAKNIYEFNRTDNEYFVRLWDKRKSGSAVTMGMAISNPDEQSDYKLIQDLKGDEAPDLVVGIQSNYVLRDEVFMDLTGFIDTEVMEKQYSNVIEAGSFNGKLYFLPVTLEIEGLVTNTDLIKDGAAGITFEEYEKRVKEEMYGFSAYDYPDSFYYNKQSFILSCIDTKSAIEGDKIEFGTEQFRTAVKYAKENIQYDDEESIPIDYVFDWKRYRGECYYLKMDDYLDYVRACRVGDKSYKIIGTPSVDASGPRFRAVETISVSANTNVKNGCKKFLNYLFSGYAYDSSECNFLQIVTNKEIMDKNITALTGINNAKYAKYEADVKSGAIIPAPGYDKAYGDKEATDEMRNSFVNSLSTISTYYYTDRRVVQFIFEELAPYFAGDRSLDDAIKYMNDRTTKYINEM